MQTGPEYVVDVSEADFAEKVLEESKKRPVVVDFWAPWCGPCRTLGPILEQEAKVAEGAFLLVKVNTDEAPALSQQLGIRGIPAVKAFIGGRIVDEFTGALPKSAVRKFLQGLKSRPEDELARDAIELAAEGRLEEADAKAQAALELDGQLRVAWVVRAQAALSRRDLDDAEHYLARAEGDPELASAIEGLRGRLAFVRAVESVHDDEPALRQRVEKADDPDAILGLAAYDVLAGRTSEAFERLLHVMTDHRKTHKEPAHKLILALFPLVDEEQSRAMRKKLSMALY